MPYHVGLREDIVWVAVGDGTPAEVDGVAWERVNKHDTLYNVQLEAVVKAQRLVGSAAGWCGRLDRLEERLLTAAVDLFAVEDPPLGKDVHVGYAAAASPATGSRRWVSFSERPRTLGAHTIRWRVARRRNVRVQREVRLFVRARRLLRMQGKPIWGGHDCASMPRMCHNLLKNVAEQIEIEEQEPQKEPAQGGEEEECVICLDKPRTHAIVPCGHLAYCAECAKSLPAAECAVCKGTIDTLCRIYR